ncbi:MAG: DUF4397 domain-containing protein [Cyclobacteriaceae bacterium]|nr:DUF4397 domain-containing protein [Cyclobacteriaceae bacterium]
MKVKSKLLNKLMIALGVVALFSLTSCLDDDDDITPEQVAFVSIYHLSPDAPDLDVELDDRLIFNQALEYTDYSNYLRFYPGSRELAFSPFNANNILVDTTVNFQADKVYSVFVSGAGSNLSTLIVEDKIESPAAGESMIRVIHLSPDAAATDFYLGDESTALISDLEFNESSEFEAIDAGEYDLNITPGGETDALVSVEKANFREGGIYTVLLRGFENAPAGNNNDLSIQIVRNQ